MYNTFITNLSDLSHHLKWHADTMAAEAIISALSAQTKGNPIQKQKKHKFKKGQFKRKAQEQAKPDADQKQKDHNDAQPAKKRRMNSKGIVCWECGK